MQNIYRIFCGLLLVFYAFPGISQIRVDTTHTAEYLVKEVLLGGGVVVGPIKYTGNSHAIALFTDSSQTLPIKKGILLTTGNAWVCQGPNKFSDMGWPNYTSGFPELEAIAKGPTHDAAILEFDFITSSESLSFHFVFASEEYPEYVGSKYNDVFGFFINGPGLTNVNLATLPKSEVPITVNSINNKKNKRFYIDNPTETINDPFVYDVKKKKVVKNMHFNKKSGLPKYNIQFDGFTTRLEATCQVVPGEIYTIQIAIADVGDYILDSGVFLEAGSFKSKGKQPIPLDKPFVKVKEPEEIVLLKDSPIPVEEPILKKVNTFKVNFDFDKHFLTDSALTVLREATNYIHQQQGTKIEIIGHTDSVGTDAYNDNLSRQRAASVAEKLITLGIGKNKLMVKYRGEKEPFATNETALGRATNRRVEIIIRSE